jgi:CubicO group peptidase (beta-lactamase class C family)
VTIDQTHTDGLAAALASALAQLDSWGVPHAAAVVITRSGPVAVAGDVEHVLPIASLSKPITAAVALLEVSAGTLQLDEPIGPTGPQGATVRHLLAHAGGLGAEVGERTMDPGRRRIYSNWGFELIGETIAARRGLPFADVLRERLTAPLGMAATSLDGSPAHAMRSSVADLARFVGELLQPTVLDAASHALLTTLAFAELDGVLPGYGRQRPNGFSLGLEVRGTKDPHWAGSRLSPATLGHFGRSGSLIWADPTRGLGLATLSGREFGDWARAAWPMLNDALVDAYDATLTR